MLAKNVEVSFDDSILRIKIKGDIDHHSAKRTREIIDLSIIDKKPLIIILDLSCVDFMDSSGLGLILGRYTIACDIGAKLVLYKPTRRIRKILELAGIERIMEIEGDGDNEAC
ncbi:MAG: STAS domain-containing protein [Clostridia bacterium]|nr:STAS domain-containing protein [Clostridia bacterium]